MRFSRFLLPVILTALALPAIVAAQTDREKLLNPLSVQVLYADNGHPVRYAQTQLYAINANSETNYSDLYRLTDGRGLARFTLLPGRYAVAVNAANLLDTFLLERTPNSPTYLTPKQFPPDMPMVEVLAGKKDATVTVRVQRGGVISGRVTAADGTPVGGGEIHLYQALKDGPPRHLAATATTDEDGIYRLTRLPAGEYLVYATDRDITAEDSDNAQQYDAGRVVNAFYPAARKFADARPVKVQTGVETPDIDIQLPALQLYALGGLVTLQGAPVHGARLSLTTQNQDAPAFSLSSTTDAAGHWRFNGLPAGQYAVEVSLYDATIETHGVRREPSVVKSPAQKFTLIDQDQTQHTIKLTPGASFSGNVADKADKTGYVMLYAHQVSLPPAEIATEPVDPKEKIAALPHFSEGFGTSEPFTLGNLPAGSYRLTMSGSFYLKAAFQGRMEVTNRIWQLAEGEEVTDLRLVLADDFGKLQGRLFADVAQRQPLIETKLIFVPVALENVAYAQGPERSDTDKKGDFTVSLPPGTYRVFAYANGDYRSPDLAAAQAQRDKLPQITVRPNDKKENLRLTVPLFAITPAPISTQSGSDWPGPNQ